MAADKNRPCLLYKKWKMIKVKVNQLSLDGKQSASASASEQLKLTRPLGSYEEKQFWNAIYLLRSKVRKIIRKAALVGNEAQRTMGEPWNCKPPPSLRSEFKFNCLIKESDIFNFQCSPNFIREHDIVTTKSDQKMPKWLRRSWQSGRFRHQRSEVQIPPSENDLFVNRSIAWYRKDEN